MKRLVQFVIIVLFSIASISAQNVTDPSEIISNGDNVFIKVEDVKKPVKDGYEEFVKILNSNEWNKWNLVENEQDADFICTLYLEKKKAGGMSTGARVVAYLTVSTVDGTKQWTSKSQTGNSNEFTLYNATKDALRKIVRRTMTKDMYN